MLLKKAKQSWKDNFDKILASSEKKEIARLKKYYQNQYRIAIDDYLKTKKINGFNELFKVTEIADQYSQIYVNIGLRFAKWYSKNFDKVISKQNDVSGYDSIWAERFNTVSQQIAAERVTLVSGTAKQTLIKVFKQLSSDPAFMSMNEREAGRILRQKFAQYSDYQAERLVRTEATNAANVATLQGATDMFGQENLQKEWMTALDGRERPAHRAADGQIVDFKEKFLVGGQLLFNPGDPAGSAKNVINCRCSTAPFPKEEAQAIAEIEGIGVRDLDSASARTVLRTPKPVKEAVEEVVEERPKAIIPDELQDKIDKGWNVGNLDYLDNLADDNINFRFATKKQARCSNYSNDRNEVTIVLGRRYQKKFNNLDQVLAHEYGHALHYKRGWITSKGRNRGYILDGDFDEDVVKHFKEQNKKIKDKLKSKPKYFENLIYPKGGDNYEFTYNTYWKNFYKYEERITKKYKITKEQYKRQWESMHDYFGALTKEEIGGGHGYFYYNQRGISGQMAEIFANAHDFYYTNNVVFKELYPEFHKDAINYMQTMLNKL